MKTSKVALYQANQIRECERLAISDGSCDAKALMVKAGRAAFSIIKQEFPHAHKIVIYCGSGNNSGDGYALAELAFKAGYSVLINQFKSPDDLPPIAREAAYRALSLGIPCFFMEDLLDSDVDLIVDALLGIGVRGEIHEPLVSAISQINESDIPVLSLDVPSGLNVDTGQILGSCVRATVTLSFISCKAGMLTLDGPDHTGKLICDDLGLGSYLATLPPFARQLESSLREHFLPKRQKNCHKNSFGHVLIIGGGEGMPGAVFLAANAALRVGAGQVSIVTKTKYARSFLAGLAEAMIYGVEHSEQLEPLISRATVCVIGPGLGEDTWALELFKKVIASHLPMIIDASALRILAKSPQYDDNWVLTPHPGEAASLLACSLKEIEANRFTAAEQLQRRYGGNIILKGLGTIVQTDQSQRFVCTKGNPGMATAGMGDVLSGVIAGVHAQGLILREATKLAVWLHSTAGDLAAEKQGERGLLASDLFPFLRLLVNEY